MLRVHFATGPQRIPVYDADMPAVPRVGDWVELGMAGTWRVNEVVWRLNDMLTKRRPGVELLVEPLDDGASSAQTGCITCLGHA